MKTKLILTSVALAAALPVLGMAKDPAKPSRTEVIYDQPEKFTDVKDDQFGTDKGREAYLSEIKEFIQQRADRALPEGQKLSITFKDIDLAGDYEPWRGPQANDIRIVKDIYPPRLKFSYRITDAAGAVVKEGDRELRDLSFQMRMTIDRNDPLRYEKDMLGDWIRSEVKPGKNS